MPDIFGTWTELPLEPLEHLSCEKKNSVIEIFSQFSKHLLLKKFLIHLMLSANIFQIFEIHFKCVTRFSTKIFCIKISRNCTFLNTIYVPNREIRMPFKVLFTFHILSIFKTTQKYICILGKLTNKYKIVPNKKRVSVSFYCNYSIYWLF